jgi:recombinational DNA repair protein RecR
MPTCEKCWNDSQGPYSTEYSYRDLVAEREAEGKSCTSEQQAGPDASKCKVCQRMTLHQHCGICMNSECASRAKSKEKP